MEWDWAHLPGVLTGAAAVLMALVSGIKNKNDRKEGVRSAQREGQVTFDTRYQNVLDQVEEHLLAPMREDLTRLRTEVDALRGELATERVALSKERAERQELQRRFDNERSERQELQRRFDLLSQEREEDLAYIDELLREWPSPPDPPQRRRSQGLP